MKKFTKRKDLRKIKNIRRRSSTKVTKRVKLNIAIKVEKDQVHTGLALIGTHTCCRRASLYRVSVTK